jgi:hypothetical protein
VLALRAVTGPGDVVAVESPTYFGDLEALTRALGVSAVRAVVDIEKRPAALLSREPLEDGGVGAMIDSRTCRRTRAGEPS